MTERELLKALLKLVDKGLFPGQGARANELMAAGNEMLGEEVAALRRQI